LKYLIGLPQRHGGTEIVIDNENRNLNQITEKVIGCAIEVHKNLGPGLLESIYEGALCCELDINKINFKKQVVLPIIYKGVTLGDYRLDLLVENEVIVELKVADRIEPVHEAQLLTYLKITGKRLGLIINFNVPILKNGIKRIIL
jgi:GxxExxY protein